MPSHPRHQPTAAPDLDLLGMPHRELVARFAEAGIKAIHAGRVWGDVHRRLTTDPARLAPDFPRVRSHIAATGYWINQPVVRTEIASTDGFTRRYLLEFGDGTTVETVIMRYHRRITACISTQAGCAMGCVFCATGQAGFRRHLTAGEIVAQAHHVSRILQAGGHRLRNVVLMGQGEPLHNFDAVMRAIEILGDVRGLSLANRRITLSTVGLVPGIDRLARENPGVSLAVSLHGATDAERNALVPIGRRWPLAELMRACRDYTAATGQRIMFEWTLIDGANDTPAHAARLAALLRGQKAHVNLIPLNPTRGFAGTPASDARARAFQAILREHDIPSTLRNRRGIDIAAGCGQLAEVASQ